MRRICLLIVVSLTIGFAHAASADEGPTLQDVVKRFADSRRNITTYDVTISASVEDAAKPVRLTNGETVTPTKKLVAFTLDVVANVRDGRILVARLDRWEDIETGKSEDQVWQVWVTAPRQTNDQAFGVGRLLSGGIKPEFFDPLALGLGLGGEYSRGDPLAKIVQNYAGWPAWKSERTKKGSLWFGSKEAVYLEFDPKKGFSPTELHSRRGNSTPFEVKLGLSKIGNNWLPTTGDVITGDEQQQLIFTWHSVNDPVEHRFSLDDIANRYQIKIPRR